MEQEKDKKKKKVQGISNDNAKYFAKKYSTSKDPEHLKWVSITDSNNDFYNNLRELTRQIKDPQEALDLIKEAKRIRSEYGLNADYEEPKGYEKVLNWWYEDNTTPNEYLEKNLNFSLKHKQQRENYRRARIKMEQEYAKIPLSVRQQRESAHAVWESIESGNDSGNIREIYNAIEQGTIRGVNAENAAHYIQQGYNVDVQDFVEGGGNYQDDW